MVDWCVRLNFDNGWRVATRQDLCLFSVDLSSGASSPNARYLYSLLYFRRMVSGGTPVVYNFSQQLSLVEVDFRSSRGAARFDVTKDSSRGVNRAKALKKLRTVRRRTSPPLSPPVGARRFRPPPMLASPCLFCTQQSRLVGVYDQV